MRLVTEGLYYGLRFFELLRNDCILSLQSFHSRLQCADLCLRCSFLSLQSFHSRLQFSNFCDFALCVTAAVLLQPLNLFLKRLDFLGHVNRRVFLLLLCLLDLLFELCDLLIVVYPRLDKF